MFRSRAIPRALAGLTLGAAVAGCAAGNWSEQANPFLSSSTASGFKFGASKKNAVVVDGTATYAKSEPGTAFKNLGTAISESSVVRKTKAAFASDKTTTIESQESPPWSSGESAPTSETYVGLARLYESRGGVEEAKSAYRKALELDANHLGAQLGLARLNDRLGHLNEATQLYRQAATAHPNEATVFNDLGLCYARQRRLNEAIDALSNAVRLAPDKVLYRNNMATVLVEARRESEAYDQLAKVHGAAAAHYNLGVLLNRQRQYQRALEHYQNAARIDPNLTAARAAADTLAARLSTGVITQTSNGAAAPAAGGIQVAPSASISIGPNLGPSLGPALEQVPVGAPEAIPPGASLEFPVEGAYSPTSQWPRMAPGPSVPPQLPYGGPGGGIVTMPPTPDEVRRYVGSSTPTSDVRSAQLPAQPVDPATFPQSRY